MSLLPWWVGEEQNIAGTPTWKGREAKFPPPKTAFSLGGKGDLNNVEGMSEHIFS